MEYEYPADSGDDSYADYKSTSQMNILTHSNIPAALGSSGPMNPSLSEGLRSDLPPLQPVPRACDYCRQRKARCSREKPQCQNCKNARRTCTYTDPILRKENPTIRITKQLNILTTRLSNIESKLAHAPHEHSTRSSDSTSLSNFTDQLNALNQQINKIDTKLESIISLISKTLKQGSLRQPSASASPISHHSSHNPLRSPKSPHDGDDVEESRHDTNCDNIDVKRLLGPTGEQLIPDGKGNMQFMGHSSDYGVTSEAQKLVGARKKLIMQSSEREGSAFSTCSGSSRNTAGGSSGTRAGDHHQIGSVGIGGYGGVGQDMLFSNENTNEEQDDAEDEEKLLSGMAHQFGGVHMSGRGEMTNSRDCLSEFDPPKLGAEHQFYIPTLEEEELLITRIEHACTSGAPLVAMLPPTEIASRVFRSPHSFYFGSSSAAHEQHQPKQPELAWPTIVFALAYCTLGKESPNDSDQIKRERKLRKHMASNAWNSFRDVKMFLTPNMLNIQALQLLSMVARDTGNMGLCWMLTCQCCRLAQAMGLHRKIDRTMSLQLTLGEMEQRKIVFWSLYALDACYSLGLGRASCFEDYDCDCDLPYVPNTLLTPEDKPKLEEVVGHIWSRYLLATIELSKLRNAVYKKLYAAKAAGVVSGLFSDVEAAVWELDGRLRGWKNSYLADFERMNFVTMLPPSHPAVVDLEMGTWNLSFSYWTIMALIHRRIFRPTFEPEENTASILSDSQIRSRNILLNSARTAIETLHSIAQRHDNYFILKWVVMHYPVAPFFVLFSKIVSTPNSTTNEMDLKIMGHLATVLKNLQKVALFLDEDVEGGEPSASGVESRRDRIEYFERDGFEKYITVVNAFMRVGQSFIRRDKLLAEKQQKDKEAVEKEGRVSEGREENNNNIHEHASGNKTSLKQVEIKEDGSENDGNRKSDWGRWPPYYSQAVSSDFARSPKGYRHKSQLHQSNLPLGPCSPRSSSRSFFSQQQEQQQLQRQIGSPHSINLSSLPANDSGTPGLATLDQQQKRQQQYQRASSDIEGDAHRQPSLNTYHSTPPSVSLRSQHLQQNHHNIQPDHQHPHHDQKPSQQTPQYAYSYPPSSAASAQIHPITSEIPQVHQPCAQAQAQAQPNNRMLQTSDFSRQNFVYPTFTFNQLQNLATMDLDLDVGMSGVETFTNNNMQTSSSSSSAITSQQQHQQLGTYPQEHRYFPSAPHSQDTTTSESPQPLQSPQIYPSQKQEQARHNLPQYSQLPPRGSGGGPSPGLNINMNTNLNPNTNLNMGYMQMFETAVRQGAMDFDWINCNWEH